MKPEYPIWVLLPGGKEEWVLRDEEQLTRKLEWFDSDDPRELASVMDARGRKVRLKVEDRKVLILEIQAKD